MAKVSFPKTYNGLSNQPPWRTQPASLENCLNLRLAIEDGMTTRNGTDLVASILSVWSDKTIDDIYFTSFRGDIIGLCEDEIRIIDGSTGLERLVNNTAAGSTYFVGLNRSTCRTATIANSVLVLNRTITTATETSPDYTVLETVNRFSDLPETASANTYYRCRFNDGAIRAGYFKRVNIDGNLSWQGVPAPDQPNALLDPSTMPVQILRLSDGSYEVSEIDWTPRRSGDDESNPAPSWVGEPLLAIGYMADRLFLISSAVISATSSKDMTLLYVDDIDAASDVSNPIEADIANSQAGEPLYATGLGSSLFILCEAGQLVYTSGQEQLTNINGQEVLVGTFKARAVMPSNSGNAVTFIDYQNTAHQYVADDSLVGVAYGTDLNSHALSVLRGENSYDGSGETLVSGIYAFGNSTFFTTNGWTRTHELTLNGADLVQTGWSKIDFNVQDDNAVEVIYMDEWEDKIRIIVKDDDQFFLLHYVHRKEAIVTGFNYSPCLDFRQYITGTYDPATNTTMFSYSRGTLSTVVVDAVDGQTIQHPVDSFTDTYVVVKGKLAGSCCVGNLYYWFADFVRFYPGVSTVSPTLAFATVFFVDTMGFRFIAARRGVKSTVTRKQYDYKTSTLGGDLITDSGIKTGHKTFTVGLDGRTALVRVEDESSVASTISALEFDIRYSDTGSK